MWCCWLCSPAPILWCCGAGRTHTDLDLSSPEIKKNQTNRDLLTRAAGTIWVLGPEPALGPFMPPAHSQSHSSAGEQLENLNFWLWELELCPRLWLPCHGQCTPYSSPALSRAGSCHSHGSENPSALPELSLPSEHPKMLGQRVRSCHPEPGCHMRLGAGRKRSGKSEFHRGFNSLISQVRLFKGEKLPTSLN